MKQYTHGERVVIFADGFGEVVTAYDADIDQFIDNEGHEWGTPEEWENITGCNGIVDESK